MPDRTDASAPHDSASQEGSLPFFTRFLEGQRAPHDGLLQSPDDNPDSSPLLSLKYPSDRDEDDWY